MALGHLFGVFSFSDTKITFHILAISYLLWRHFVNIV